MFVDRATLYVEGGDGGNGAIAFRREKYVPRGGPDGGDGGDGGSIILRATADVTNLAHLAHRKHWRAERGEPGQGKGCHGKGGADLIIDVPAGTVVRDRDRGNLIRDLNEVGQHVTVVRGGKGGKGNKRFATSTNQAPRIAEPGGKGERRWITLELKVIADVGLCGMPNAGKSTLLSRISHATPEIADYPFTTKYPSLGIVHIDRDRTFVMADIPGLIEGAHTGTGLGHEFLRHVERCRVLVHLVEPLPPDGTDPVQNYFTIRRELELYSPELARRPELVAVTKADLGPEVEDQRRRLADAIGRGVLAISAVTGQGLAELVHRTTELLDAARAAEVAGEPRLEVPAGGPGQPL